MSKNKFRIVEDNHSGYEVQIKFWWFPFIWFQVCHNLSILGTNTFGSIEEAKEFIVEIVSKPHHKSNVIIEYVDVDELLAEENK